MMSAQGHLAAAQTQVVSAPTQILQQATSPTSRHATSDHFSFAERDGSDGAEASLSRPSNAPRRANRYAPTQNADALQSCSCRTLKLPMVRPPSTQTQQLLRRASGRPAFNHIQPVTPAQILLMGQTFKHRKLHIIPGLKGQYRCPINHIRARGRRAASAESRPHVRPTAPLAFPAKPRWLGLVRNAGWSLQVYGGRFAAASFAWGRFSRRGQRRPPQLLPRSLTDLATIGRDKVLGS